jgi:hypothetical protein
MGQPVTGDISRGFRIEFEYVPGEHCIQVEEPPELYVPGAHDIQVAEEVAPIAVL